MIGARSSVRSASTPKAWSPDSRRRRTESALSASLNQAVSGSHPCALSIPESVRCFLGLSASVRPVRHALGTLRHCAASPFALSRLTFNTPALGLTNGHYAPPRQHRFVRKDRKSTRLNSSHLRISYAVFCLKTEDHTSELQSPQNLVCRLPLDNKEPISA